MNVLQIKTTSRIVTHIARFQGLKKHPECFTG
jgi:hypothetical protein